MALAADNKIRYALNLKLQFFLFSYLALVTGVAMELQQITHSSRSLETLCRHVDYVITGKHRQLSADGFSEEEQAKASQSASLDTPPVDLFDLLFLVRNTKRSILIDVI